MIAIVCGVSGSGKSTVGQQLADALGVPFLEGDELHDATSVGKLRAGTPLTEADRAPWLARIRDWTLARTEGVVACSALTRRARATLRAPHVRFVLLDVPRAELERRVATRHHAFMPASLLPSQLATLESADGEPDVTVVHAGGSVDEVVRSVRSLF